MSRLTIDSYDEWVTEIFNRWHEAQMHAIERHGENWKQSVVSLPGYIIRRLGLHVDKKHLAARLMETLNIHSTKSLTHGDLDLVPGILEFLKEEWE